MNVSLTDDQLVEQTEEISLALNPLTTRVLPEGIALIQIFDSDGEIIFHSERYRINYFLYHSSGGVSVPSDCL